MLGDVASFLFSRLVSSEESAKSVSAEKVRDDLLKDAHIASSPLVKTNKRIPITTANGGTIHHEFHLWIGNGSPEFLAHVVPLTNHPRAVKQAADALVLRFERVVQAGKVDPKKCIALTYSVEERDDEMIDESLLELGSVAQVFDVHPFPQRTYFVSASGLY